jgi:hypothetical protein
MTPNAGASSALRATRSERLSVGLFAVILLITLLASMNTIYGFVLGGRAVTSARTIIATLLATVPAAGLFGAAFGMIATRRTATLAVLVALPPTIATVALFALFIWLTPLSFSAVGGSLMKSAAFFPLFVGTASLVDHFAAGISLKKRVIIGTVLFAGTAVVSLVLSLPMVLLGLTFGTIFPIISMICLIAFVVAIVLVVMLWREAWRR